MNKEQIKELLDLKTDLLIKNPRWREGQALFNALFILHSEKADIIRGTELDPFHLDSRCNELLIFLDNNN